MGKQYFASDKLKFINKSYIDTLSIIRLFLWSIFVTLMITFLILMINERSYINAHTICGSGIVGEYPQGTTIDNWLKYIAQHPDSLSLPNIYQAMVNVHHPIIDFSLMSFLGGISVASFTDYATAWNVHDQNITLAYSYVFIATMISVIALFMYLYVNVIMLHQHYVEKKLALSTKYTSSSVSYRIFYNKMINEFITNLAIIFAFFNFLSTLIVNAYWLILYSVKWINGKLSRNSDLAVLNTFASNRNDLIYLIFIMIFQNAYTILKTIFIKEFGVNLDLIFSIVLPIGTITVIIGLFIKNLLSSKVSATLKAIRNINVTVNNFDVFFHAAKMAALDDYNFVTILPPMIKTPLTNGTIDKNQAFVLMQQLDEAIDFVKHHINPKKAHDLNYLLWVLFNQINDIDEITEIKTNLLKLHSKH
ncbi:MAG: hypothetical protein LBT77_00980 [Mycoplasmataceae bacterium]|nr:hypothetical protein [Mycoplasmataceae bacterium]